jgi:3-methyladenine DNA glycosylase/8-oxoguanine DNA glycosylase
LIPCHRVIGASGDLTGFSSGGLANKAQLLAIEGHCFFDTDFSAAKRHLRRTFPELRSYLSQPITLPREPKANLFGALVRTVVHQQLAPAAASAILARVQSALGPFTPARAPSIMQTPVDDLRKLGLSANKAESMRDIASRVADGTLDAKSLLRLPDEKIIDSLTGLRGIGRWSAEILMIFELARPDVLPAGDYALATCFQALCADRDLPDYAQQWAPYRSIASAYLWKAHETVAKQPKKKVS